MLNRTDLVSKIAEKTKMTKKQTAIFATAYEEAIIELLASGASIQLVGFATFGTKDRKAKNGRNPKTGETIVIPAKKAVAVKLGAKLKNALIKE